MASLSVPVSAWRARHPEAVTLVLVAAAWSWLVVGHVAHHGDAPPASWRFDVVGWSVMVVAMMVPGIVPAMRRVAFDSLWSRRGRAMTLFVLTFGVVWVAAGLVGSLVVSSTGRITGATLEPGGIAVVAALVGAGGWQFTSIKRRSIARCHRRRSLAPTGRAADRSVIRYGASHGSACIGTCGPMMGAMLLSAHDLHLMVPLTGVTLWERYQPRPKPWPGAAILWSTAAVQAAPLF